MFVDMEELDFVLCGRLCDIPRSYMGTLKRQLLRISIAFAEYARWSIRVD